MNWGQCIRRMRERGFIADEFTIVWHGGQMRPDKGREKDAEVECSRKPFRGVTATFEDNFHEGDKRVATVRDASLELVVMEGHPPRGPASSEHLCRHRRRSSLVRLIINDTQLVQLSQLATSI